MKVYLSAIFFCVVAFTTPVLAQRLTIPYKLVKRDADQKAGFSYPYYLYIPDNIKTAEELKIRRTILVAPNNTGRINDTLAVHEESAKKQILIWAKIAEQLPTVVLMPVFPRPASEPKLYTHALDRDAMLSKDERYKRFDLQLISMIADAKKYLQTENIVTDNRIWITGFSASGMFVNRFTFLHPKLVKAAAIGSPGGWPIAPAESFNGKQLRYPIGTADFKLVSGKSFDIKNARKVPQFIYMGDMDENDSVVYPDSYDPEDKELIFGLFGETLMKRWPIIQALYQKENFAATFQLYPGKKHAIYNDMIADMVKFFKASLN